MGDLPGNKLQESFDNSTLVDTVVLHPLTLEDHPIDATPAIRVVIVGAGISGITAAVLLPEKVSGIDLAIYERSREIVGSHSHFPTNCTPD